MAYAAAAAATSAPGAATVASPALQGSATCVSSTADSRIVLNPRHDSGTVPLLSVAAGMFLMPADQLRLQARRGRVLEPTLRCIEVPATAGDALASSEPEVAGVSHSPSRACFMTPTVLQSNIVTGGGSPTSAMAAAMRSSTPELELQGPQRAGNRVWSSFLRVPDAQVLGLRDVLDMIPRKSKVSIVVQRTARGCGSVALVTENQACMGITVRIIQNSMCSHLKGRLADDRLHALEQRIHALIRAHGHLTMTTFRVKFLEMFNTEFLPSLYGRPDPTSVIKLFTSIAIESTGDDKLIHRASNILPHLVNPEQQLHQKTHLMIVHAANAKRLERRLLTSVIGAALVDGAEGVELKLDAEFAQCLAAIEEAGHFENFIAHVQRRLNRDEVGKRGPVAYLDGIARSYLSNFLLVPVMPDRKLYDFIPSSAFTGRRDGYYFGIAKDGRLGYIRDDNPTRAGCPATLLSPIGSSCRRTSSTGAEAVSSCSNQGPSSPVFRFSSPVVLASSNASIATIASDQPPDPQELQLPPSQPPAWMPVVPATSSNGGALVVGGGAASLARVSILPEYRGVPRQFHIIGNILSQQSRNGSLSPLWSVDGFL